MKISRVAAPPFSTFSWCLSSAFSSTFWAGFMQHVSISILGRQIGREEGLHASYWRPHAVLGHPKLPGHRARRWVLISLGFQASFRCRPEVRPLATSIWPFCGRRGVLHEDVKRGRMRLTRLSAIAMSIQATSIQTGARCGSIWPVWRHKFAGPFGPGLAHV